MAITLKDNFTIPYATIFPSGAGDGFIKWMVRNGDLVYIQANNGTPVYRTIDVSNPLAPVGSSFTVTEAYDLNGQSSTATSEAFIDVANDFIYVAHVISNSHVFLQRITISTGLVQFSQRLGISLGVNPRDRVGVTVTGGEAYVYSLWSNDHRIAVYSLTSIVWSALRDQGSQLNTSEYITPVLSGIAYPITGMTVASDASLLVFYDDRNLVEKYATAGTYLGATEWVGTGATTISSSNGYVWACNDVITSAQSLTVQKFLDESTGIVSASRSRVVIDDRLIRIGENIQVTIIFEAKDDFGAPVTSVYGELCRFAIMTNRGLLDSDDAALSSSYAGPYRTAGGAPLNRQVDVAFDGLGKARAYFQSARQSAASVIEDTVRVSYPAS